MYSFLAEPTAETPPDVKSAAPAVAPDVVPGGAAAAAASVQGGGGAASVQGGGGAPAPSSVRVVSFNLNEVASKDREKAEDIAKILGSLNADIICLQEISKPRTVGWLARRLGMFYRASATTKGGMMVLSRQPIAQVRCIPIPDSYYNSLVAVEVGGVWYASVHLFSEEYKRNEAVRLGELRWILAHFAPRVGVMAGDWNSVSHLDTRPAGAPRPKMLPSHLLRERQWGDAHAYAGKNPERAPISTWMQAAKDGGERIDRIHFFPRSGWRVRRRAILGPADFPFLHGRGWPTGRDHRLVVADLERVS